MSLLLWLDESEDLAIDLGDPFEAYKSFAEMAELAGTKSKGWEELFSVPGEAEQDVEAEWVSKVAEQADRFLDTYDGDISDHTRWLLLRLAGKRQPPKKSVPWEEGKHPRGEAGQFGSGGGGKNPAEDKKPQGLTLDQSKIPASAAEAGQQARQASAGILKKFAQLPKRAWQYGVSKATALYQKMEKKYGKGWARAIVAVGILTLPTPFTTGSVMATVGLAHVCTRMFGSKAQGQGADMGQAFQFAQAIFAKFAKELDGVELSDEERGQIEAMMKEGEK